MQYYNNILAVEAQWLISSGIVTEANYRKLAQRGDFQVVRRGCRGQEALVAYESMPERFRRAVRDIIADPYRAVQVNQVEECIEHSADASAWFDSYEVCDGRHLPADRRREYYTNAIVLDAIARLIARRAAKRHALAGTPTRFWDTIAQAVQDLDPVRYPHTLPANPRSLERKHKRYTAEGYESLVHTNYLSGQRNAAKIDDEHKSSALAMLVSDPRNLDNEQVARIYNTLAEQMGWKPVTASAVAVWRKKLDADTYARRRGATAYRNSRLMQVRRSAPAYPLYYWTLDGWDVELLYQRTEGGKTTYHHRPTVVFVLDACCRYPIGYAIGTHETPELIRQALRNAARHTGELFGQMYRTAQLQSDNYAIGKMTPLYQGMADKVTPAAAKNAKAKIIEPWFRAINKKYCQLQPNWSGFGVTSRKESQPNSEFLNKHRHSFPDWDGVCRQIDAMVAAERAELRDRYVELFEQMPAENRFPLSTDQYLLLYGATTGHTNLLTGSGLRVTIGGTVRHYDSFDPAFRAHASVRWQVRFDPDDLSRALAVNADETLRFPLEEKHVQPMALIERTEGDYEQLRRVMDFNRAEELRVANAMGERADRVAAMLESRKELDTLQKLLIVDSDGQHKNRRNSARLTRSELLGGDVFDTGGADIYDDY